MLKLDSKRLHDLGYIFSRNVLILTNGVLLGVVALLVWFHDVQSAIFIGLVLFINILLGLGQDIRAWFALENLQILTAPHVVRINPDQTEALVLIEAIKKADLIRCRVGDQIPCDGTVLESDSLEINEGLITGEATSLPRAVGTTLLAGSIITSGSGVMQAAGVFAESRIARMTEGIKGYAIAQSPIQHATSLAVTYAGYGLIAAILFVVVQGWYTGIETVVVVKEIGALAGTLVPQGLIFAMTLLFAYGAAHLFNRQVLLQEVNATEKLGRIKNLCLDKTGTLTENALTVERMEVPTGSDEIEVMRRLAAYVAGAADHSQIGRATKNFSHELFDGTVLESLAFSSWRLFGAVKVDDPHFGQDVLLLGAPDRLLSAVKASNLRDWLKTLVATETQQGKRVLCLVRVLGETLPTELNGHTVIPLAALIYVEKLRPGITDAINFFQNRGVQLRIISGDNKETVRAVAMMAGVHGCERIITGAEMKEWTAEVFKAQASRYTIFARILPEQKEKLIEALKLSGFTAMVGDGANDALALKKADLGIAMWDGAPATRQIASVVLMNNSFTALPGGVTLADSIIKNAEIFAAIFFDFAFVGFFLLVLVGFLGYPYPLSPLNVTLINYFAVGVPSILISYWTIKPARVEMVPAPSGESFFPAILPYTSISAGLQSIALGIIFWLSPEAMKTSGVNLFVIVAAIVLCVTFFFFTPKVFRGQMTVSESYTLWGVVAGEALLLLAIFNVPYLLTFFDIHNEWSDLTPSGPVVLVLLGYSISQALVSSIYRHRHERRRAAL